MFIFICVIEANLPWSWKIDLVITSAMLLSVQMVYPVGVPIQSATKARLMQWTSRNKIRYKFIHLYYLLLHISYPISSFKRENKKKNLHYHQFALKSGDKVRLLHKANSCVTRSSSTKDLFRSKLLLFAAFPCLNPLCV